MLESTVSYDLAKQRLAEEIERGRAEALANSVRRRRGRPPTGVLVRVRAAAWLHGLADRIQPLSDRIGQPTT